MPENCIRRAGPETRHPSRIANSLADRDLRSMARHGEQPVAVTTVENPPRDVAQTQHRGSVGATG